MNKEYMYYKMKGYNSKVVGRIIGTPEKTISNWNKKLRDMDLDEFDKLLLKIGVELK